MATRGRSRALRAEDVPPGTCIKGMLGGKEVAIFNVDGQFYATQSDCTHMGGPLCEGSLAGEVVTCPWHGSQFNVRNGEIVMDPAEEPIETYPVHVRDGVLVLGRGA
jgi:nitrite reductase/ring-hydroxylating ferredoxin subunit